MLNVRLTLTLPPIPLLQPEQAQALIRREVGTAITDVVEAIADQARQRTPVNTGTLRASIATRVTQGVDASQLVRGEVFTGHQAPYAPYVEEGRRPGNFPPRAPLELWAQRVLGDRRLWFVVARAIARRGIRGRYMFRDALTQVQPRIQPALEAAVARAARLLGGSA